MRRLLHALLFSALVYTVAGSFEEICRQSHGTDEQVHAVMIPKAQPRRATGDRSGFDISSLLVDSGSVQFESDADTLTMSVSEGTQLRATVSARRDGSNSGHQGSMLGAQFDTFQDSIDSNVAGGYHGGNHYLHKLANGDHVELNLPAGTAVIWDETDSVWAPRAPAANAVFEDALWEVLMASDNAKIKKFRRCDTVLSAATFNHIVDGTLAAAAGAGALTGLHSCHSTKVVTAECLAYGAGGAAIAINSSPAAAWAFVGDLNGAAAPANAGLAWRARWRTPGGLIVKAISTMFPNNWTRKRIRLEICWAFLVEMTVSNAGNNGWSGDSATTAGFQIDGFCNGGNGCHKNGRTISSAFPN